MIGLAPFQVPGPARWHTAFYRSAGTFLARHCLAGPEVKGIYLRRSVAAGEAQFPWSDIDLAMVLSAFSSAEEEGLALAELLRRFHRARTIFPRLGETLIYTANDFDESVDDDPYRASIDQRAAIVIHGEIPKAKSARIAPFAAIRRLVFWLEAYLPRALRTRNHRNARKFAIEMWNAWRVCSGEIQEPFISRREAERDWRNSDSAALLSHTDHGAEGSFRVSLTLANRAHPVLRPALPRLTKTVSLRTLPRPDVSPRTLHIIPSPDSPIPQRPIEANAMILTPEALDLLLNTQNPFLWHDLPDSVHALGIEPPSRDAWLDTCRRWSAQTRLRIAGFVESGTGNPETRLARVERALDELKRGEIPVRGRQEVRHAEAPHDGLQAYYQQRYPALLRRSIQLREFSEQLLARNAPMR